MTTEPKKLGKYNIVGKIGKGAMGEVYKGHDPALNRYVAIKTIAESIDADADLIERFRREARNAAQLNHPNIITIFDFVEEGGTLYMVMELLEGQDLKSLIKSGAPLTMDQILGIMEQIADGLGFAHTKGIVHRDLKPANIHISKNGQVKILDFGLVHEASSDMTKTGHIMGTPNYMSPEQVQGLKVDPRSDIFSLGAVFYEFLTRKKPFSADSIHATMFKVVQGDREPLSRYTQLPQPIVDVVDRSLDPNPEGRFEDANALRAHLRGIRREVLSGAEADATMTNMVDSTMLAPTLEGGSAASVKPSPGKSARPRPRTGPSASGSRGTFRQRDVPGASAKDVARPRRPVALYALAAIVVVAAGAGAYYLTRGSESAGPSVEELSRALLESQQELMVRSFEQRDYTSALVQAEDLLASDPDNAEALRIQREARQALERIDASVNEARAALERGATDEAAEALSRVLALDPTHPLGAELSDQLNQHFQSRADGARTEMDAARNAASAAGASGRPEFRRAESLRQDASADFNRGEYTNSAQKYMEARDLYQQSRTAHQQALAAERAQSQREAQAARAEAERRAELQAAQNAWNRLHQSVGSEPGISEQPSYQDAVDEQRTAERLESSGDLEGAARAYETAVSHLERARRELAQAEAQRAREEEARRAEAAPPPTTAPPTSSAPTRAEEEAAIRQVLANYERALETEDLALFRETKPNLTAEEEKRLQEAFEGMDSHMVEMSIETIAFEGTTATVEVSRRDVIVIRGRTQNGNTRRQTFVLSKTGGRWVIEQIGQ